MTVTLTKEQVKALQEQLAALGYFTGTSGLMSGATERAYLAYYEDRKLVAPMLRTLTEVPVMTAITPTPAP